MTELGKKCWDPPKGFSKTKSIHTQTFNRLTQFGVAVEVCKTCF